MTIPAEVDVVLASDNEAGSSYVDWPAIIAGIIFASAISVLLLTFGSAVGLSFTNFNARPDVSPIWLGIAAASWLLWVQISSFMAGGYLTGRLRKRHGDATEDESDVRDGAHGLLVWAGALIVGAVLAIGGIGATANAVGSALSTATTAASNVAGDAAEALDPNAYFVDTLFRPAPAGTDDTAEAPAAEAPAASTEVPATTAQAPADGTAAPGATPAPATTAEPATPVTDAAVATMAPPIVDLDAVRGETGRIFARAATGELPDSDRTYLAQLVAQQTGLSEDEAATRVDEVVAAMDAAKAEAAETAEAARKTSVIAAFLIAASLLVSAIGAFWAAQKGGNHRDKNTPLPGVFNRF
jgi:hypothetical protein